MKRDHKKNCIVFVLLLCSTILSINGKNSSVTTPETPDPIIVIDITCNSATLQKYPINTIPNGEMWYWQGTTKYGTDMNFLATNDYPVSTPGTYRLRARNQTTGVWSSRDSFVQVSFDSSVVYPWYADSDGDGLGDPNNVTNQGSVLNWRFCRNCKI